MDVKRRALIGKFGLALAVLMALPSALRLIQWGAYGSMAIALGEMPNGGWLNALGHSFLYSGWVDVVCKWLCEDGLAILAHVQAKAMSTRVDLSLLNPTIQGAAVCLAVAMMSMVQIAAIHLAFRTIRRWAMPRALDARQASLLEARVIGSSARDPRRTSDRCRRL